MKFTLTTRYNAEGLIIQELHQQINDQTSELTRWITNTRDEGVRKALMDLGWRPPLLEYPEKIKCYNDSCHLQHNYICIINNINCNQHIPMKVLSNMSESKEETDNAAETTD